MRVTGTLDVEQEFRRRAREHARRRPGASGVTRALGAACARFTLVARSAGARRGPWLRRETWTRENLRGAGGGRPRERPRAHGGGGRVVVMAVVAHRGWLLRSTTAGRRDRGGPEGPPSTSRSSRPGRIQALRSVTYASTIQSNQAKIIALAPEGKLVAEGRPADPLRRRALRGGDPPQPGPARAGAGRPPEGAAGPQAPGHPEPRGAGGRAPEGGAQRARARATCSEGKGRLKEEEANAAVANAERELQKAETAPTTT